MKKVNLLSLQVLASILVGSAFLYFLLKNENVINLDRIYSSTPTISSSENCSNFIQMTDGTVLFLNPLEFEKIVAVYRRSALPFEASFLMMAYPNRELKEVTLQVSFSGNSLHIGKFEVKPSEIERLRLQPEWLLLQAVCLGEPTIAELAVADSKGNYFKGLGIDRGAISRLTDGTFVITGGVDRGKAVVGSTVAQMATVYEPKTNSILRTFRLREEWVDHQSITLKNGNIALVGNRPWEDVAQKIEIIDPVRGTSSLLNCAPQARNGSTLCIDETGRCIIIGGWSNLKDCLEIEEIDFLKCSSLKIANLRLPRHFNCSFLKYQGAPQAVFLDREHVLVSGGGMLTGIQGSGPRKDAEIITIPK